MPNIPIYSPHPVGWVNPVTMRASAALPAAGAWDAAPTEQNVAGANYVMLYFTYEEDAQGGGGAFDFQIQASAYSVAANAPTDAGEWADESVYAAGPVAPGADTESEVQAEYETFAPTSGDPETFAYGPLHLQTTVERLRIPCRESGDTDNPGNLVVVMECYP